MNNVPQAATSLLYFITHIIVTAFQMVSVIHGRLITNSKTVIQDVGFSRRWRFKLRSSELWHHIVLQ